MSATLKVHTGPPTVFVDGTQAGEPEWCGPGPGREAHWDFSTLACRFGRILDANPDALFHLRIHLRMPERWQRLYTAACEVRLHFADCIRTGKPPRTPGSSGRAVIEAISAAYLSAQEGRRVDLPLTRLPGYERLFRGLERRLPPRYREAVK
jgi:hypothetical protein